MCFMYSLVLATNSCVCYYFLFVITRVVKKNSKIVHSVIFDRIELGTYMIASALQAKKYITINKIDPKLIKIEIDILKKIGVQIKKKK